MMPETSPGDVGRRTAAPGSSEGNEQDKRPRTRRFAFQLQKFKGDGKILKEGRGGGKRIIYREAKTRIVANVSTDAARGEENGVKYLKC